MSDPQPPRSARRADPVSPPRDKRNLFERLVEFLSPGPDSRAELMKTLADAEQRELIEPESRAMVEGVLRMAEKSAGDVMVAAPRMDMLDIEARYDELLDAVISTAHSRFPVYEGSRENIIGILMAKDLLKLQRAPELNLRTLLRPAVFVPESKRLNELLRDVGEIEDEFDEEDSGAAIYTLADGTHRVAGDADVEDVNEAFGVGLPTDDFDTIGGLVAHELGRVPRRGEAVDVAGLRFTVMLARGGAVRWFKVSRVPASAPAAG